MARKYLNMDYFKAKAYTAWAWGDLKTRGLGALGLCVRGVQCSVWYLGLRSSAAAGLEFREFRAINVKGLRALASSKLRVGELGLGG